MASKFKFGAQDEEPGVLTPLEISPELLSAFRVSVLLQLQQLNWR